MRRRAAVLAGLVAALLAPLPAQAAPGDGGRQFGQDAGRPVHITLGRLEPRTITPGATILVSGSLVNDSGDTFTDLSVRLQRGPLLTTRRALAADEADPSLGNAATAPFLPVPGELDPGDSITFSYTAAAADLRLPAEGVFPALINVNGTRAGGQTERVGELSTYLVAQPAVPTSRTTVAWLWPLTDRPHRNAAGAFTDDELAAEVAPDGRLDRAVEVLEELPPAPGGQPGSAVPVTLAVDPALLEEISTMAAGPYTVVGTTGGGSRAGAGSRDAAGLLDRLRAVAAVHPVVALPYGDVDADSLVSVGQSAVVTRSLPGTAEGTAHQPVDGDGTATPTAPTSSASASSGAAGSAGGNASNSDASNSDASTGAGAATITRILDVQPRTDLAWPAGGTVREDTLRTLQSGGIRELVLSDEGLTGGDRALGGTGAVAARTEITTPDGPVTTLVADGALTAAVTHASRDQSSGRLAEQRYLAELGVLTTQPATVHPAAAQTVLVVPPRQVDVDPSWAGAMIGDTVTEPWLAAASVQDLAAGPVTDTGGLPDPAGPGTLLPRDGLEEIAAASAVRNDVAAAVVGDPATVLAGYDAAIARAASAAWRSDPAGFATATADLRKTLEGLRTEVTLLAPADGTYSLASSDAPLVLTVQNDLPFAVDVRLDLHARGNVGLTTDDIGVTTLQPQSRTTVQVPAHVRQSGGFAVTAALTTPAGGPLGEPVQIHVKSTAYGTVTLAITLGAAVLLGLLFLRRLVRFLRGRRHDGPPADDGSVGPAGPATLPTVRSPV